MKHNVNKLIDTISDKLKAKVDINNTHIIGIETGGLKVAQKIAECLKFKRQVSSLNISFYRDDFTKLGLHPEVRPSKLHDEVENKEIVLVDDVLHTGRTIRAALNEIFDYGRPSKVILVILIDRKDNELPIAPDICGLELKLKPSQEVKLTERNHILNLEVVELE